MFFLDRACETRKVIGEIIAKERERVRKGEGHGKGEREGSDSSMKC